jgi:hypothetical protein
MMSKIKLTIILFLSFCLFAGCAGVNTVVYIPSDVHVKKRPHKTGPPSHAPAHGYRHKHQHGVELEYDSGIDAYLVIEFPGTYFHNGLYSRFSPEEHWLVAVNLNGPWRIPKEREIPLKLINVYEDDHPGKGKGHKKRKKNKKW